MDFVTAKQDIATTEDCKETSGVIQERGWAVKSSSR